MARCPQLDISIPQRSKVRFCSAHSCRRQPAETDLLVKNIIRFFPIWTCFPSAFSPFALLQQNDQGQPLLSQVVTFYKKDFSAKGHPTPLWYCQLLPACALLKRVQPSGCKVCLTKDSSWSNGTILSRSSWEEMFMRKTGISAWTNHLQICPGWRKSLCTLGYACAELKRLLLQSSLVEKQMSDRGADRWGPQI